MTTVNTQDNPIVPIVGARDADAVIIESQQDTNGIVTYQIEKLSTADVVNINSNMDSQKGGNIISVSKTVLKVILESRTKYRVRTKAQFGPWSAWADFTTRDKRYQSPHAITQLTDDTDSSAQTQGQKTLSGGSRVSQGGNRTIVVTNNAKAVERDNSRPNNELAARRWGAVTVTNTDTIYADGQLQTIDILTSDNKFSTVQVPVVDTPRGAKVINVPAGKNDRIRYTNRGATINTIG